MRSSISLALGILLCEYFQAFAFLNLPIMGGMFASQKLDLNSQYPVLGDDALMSPKNHGTCTVPVMKELKWNVNHGEADKICCFNRHYAEYSGYWLSTSFLKEVDRDQPITFYDSVSGVPLFVAPKGRTFQEFVDESKSHGWPSFRDQEVIWDNVRSLQDGEIVSLQGSHLGHNLPDRLGNRYCINLVSIAGTSKNSEVKDNL